MSARKVTSRRITCRYSTWLPPGQRETYRTARFHAMALADGFDDDDIDVVLWLEEADRADRFHTRDF